MNYMPRFVILQHDHPYLHWDLMLQSGEVLRTWRLEKPPSSGNEAIAAIALGDHRLMYLDYEGPVSGGRGAVARWDQGTYSEAVPEQAPATQRVEVHLHGDRLAGKAVLECRVGEEWTFRFY